MLAQSADGKLSFALYAISFNHLGTNQVHYENSPKFWLEFASRWPDVESFEVNPVAPTAEQSARFVQMQPLVTTPELVTRWLSELSDYVQYGAVDAESLCPALVALKGTPAALAGNLAKFKAQKLSELAAHRYSVETQGAALASGAMIATTRAHQAQLNSVFTTLSANIVPSVSFKSPEGFSTATLQSLRPLYETVVKHVQKAFSVEATIDTAVRAATDIEALKAMDVRADFNTAWAV